jgi:hypothetical protein
VTENPVGRWEKRLGIVGRYQSAKMADEAGDSKLTWGWYMEQWVAADIVGLWYKGIKIRIMKDRRFG